MILNVILSITLKYRSIFGAGGSVYWQIKNTFNVKQNFENLRHALGNSEH